ncbi:MAG TPA: GFA family protein [Gammaproteobacteria bacterium]|nr:GFA family protein [Gammaproteobacteria bacterium]
MAKKTYHGSCHCGRVRFQADIDLSAGTGKCNCTYCTKVRNWNVILKPDALHDVQGEEHLTAYWDSRRPETFGKHMFCKHCGVRTFDRGHLEEIGGDYVSIALASLDDASIDELVGGPVRFADGRSDNWLNPPADTRNL